VAQDDEGSLLLAEEVRLRQVVPVPAPCVTEVVALESVSPMVALAGVATSAVTGVQLVELAGEGVCLHYPRGWWRT
jgi:hypothetical protein